MDNKIKRTFDHPLNPGKEGSFWAQLAGFRLPSGQFQSGSYYGTYWWSSTEVSSGTAFAAYCGSLDIDKVSTAERNKKSGNRGVQPIIMWTAADKMFKPPQPAWIRDLTSSCVIKTKPPDQLRGLFLLKIILLPFGQLQ